MSFISIIDAIFFLFLLVAAFKIAGIRYRNGMLKKKQGKS